MFLNIKTPETYITENKIISKAGKYISEYGRNPLIIAGKTAFNAVNENFIASLKDSGINHANIEFFEGYPSQRQFNLYAKKALEVGADVIIGIGGGRVIDTAKAVGDTVSLPVVAVPTVGATCAAWAAVTIQYDDEGGFVDFSLNKHSAKLVLADPIVGWNNRLCNAIYPIAKAIFTVPPLIYTPYVVLVMPTFKMASFFVIFLSIFWGSFMGSINNTRFVEKKIINSAIVLNLSVPTILFKIIIPFNLPRIINALPINLATALMTLTAAEMLGADNGMGYYVRYSLSFANYTKAIAGIIFIGLVVTILNSVINVLKKHLIKWNY